MKNQLFTLLLSLLVFTSTAQEIFIKNEKYGLKDNLGKIITKAKFDHINDFVDNIAVTKLKDKYGIINSSGIEIIEPIYQEIKPFVYLSIYIDVQLDGKWGVLNSQGKEVIAPKYHEPVEINYFSDYTIVCLAKSIEVSSGKVKSKMYGAIDNETLKEVISPKYVYLKSQDFGYFEARTDEKYKKFGLIDVNEKVIFPMEYENVFAISKDIIAFEKNKKFVLVNSKGYSISSVSYDEVYKLSENRAKVKRNGKFGFIDEKGKEVIPCQYDEVEYYFYKGKIKVTLNGKKIEIDINGNEVTVSETIKPREDLIFINGSDEIAFNLINFKENVADSKNLKLVDNYLSNTKNYTAVIASVDNLMSEAANNKTAYKEFANYLYAKYSNSDYACYDAIPIHVSQKYMCDTDAPYGGGYWLGAENKKEICDYGKKNKPSLCGEKVSDVHIKLLPQTNSKYLHLDDVESKYTLLLFWSNDCPYCEKQIQFLASNYAELKKSGVEIIGISGDYEAKDKAEQLIVSNNMDWINTVDLNHSFIKKLNVTAYPHLFLLDKDKKIIIKAISAEQTLEYLKSQNN
ncbi:WG repeat-containing protein [Flavobacterium sp.]|uniref:WG repeat-containing protein n=1 Tax=Flavobacterium sp. TaxID=239 RepID=UPI00286A2F5D|nr:WG repeat-containing protein [Flavobacterium sp.]